MLLGRAGGSLPLAAAIVSACVALAAAGCGSSPATELHTTSRHGLAHHTAGAGSASSKTASRHRPAHSEANAEPLFPETSGNPQLEKARKAAEQQITPALQAQGATPTEISCVVGRVESLSDVRFQALTSSPARARAALRSFVAQCGGP